MFPKVVVLILSWNKKELTCACLDSLETTDYPNCQIAVIDNGSEDGTEEEILRKYLRAHVIQNGENLGYAEGNNRGISWALKNGADYIFLANNDTKINSDCVSQLVRIAEENRDFGILGPLAFDYEAGQKPLNAGFELDWSLKECFPLKGIDGFYVLEQDKNIFPIDVVQGDAFFVRRIVFEKIGLFDPRFFCMHEESDFCLRAKKCGYKIGVVRDARFRRMVATSIGAGSTLQRYYAVRNIFLLISNHTRGKEKLRKFIWQLKRMKWAVWDYYVAMFLKTRDVKHLTDSLPIVRGCIDYFLGRFGKAKAG